MLLDEGRTAPDFSLPDETGKIRKLSDYRGKQLVLYFYPKDDTPGCTKEACNFRDDYSDYTNAGIEILGVSPDSPKRHKNFIKKYSLPFTLLADEDHQVCSLYGVWGMKKIFGREIEGVLRTTYIIDAQGKIIKVFQNVRPANHSKEILQLLSENI